MSDQPSNAVLATKIDALKELMEMRFLANDESHSKTNSHLEKLNGQVTKNTKFRWQAAIYGSIAIIIVPLLLSKIIDKIT